MPFFTMSVYTILTAQLVYIGHRASNFGYFGVTRLLVIGLGKTQFMTNRSPQLSIFSFFTQVQALVRYGNDSCKKPRYE